MKTEKDVQADKPCERCGADRTACPCVVPEQGRRQELLLCLDCAVPAVIKFGWLYGWFVSATPPPLERVMRKRLQELYTP